MKTQMFLSTRLVLFLVLVGALPAVAQPTTIKPNDWREDLQVLSTELPRLHLNLFFQMSRADFDNAVTRLDHDIPSLTDAQIIVRMAEIVAMAGDTHTNLSLSQSAVQFQSYPIRLQWFTDGIFVIAALPEYRSALGKKLVKIGATSIEQVYEEVGKVIPHENEPTHQYFSQGYLVIPEVLHALGVLTDTDKAPFVFQDTAGNTIALNLVPISRMSSIDWLFAVEASKMTLPLYLKHRFSNFTYWVEALTDSDTIYLKYNQCRSDAGLPFDYLAGVVLNYVNRGLIKRLIIDVRNNTGGNSEVIRPLLTSLQQSAAMGLINPSTDLFLIIGRQSFSSAVMNAIQFKKISAALVGEPTGGKPNGYGDIKTLTLPKSGMVISYSTKYFRQLDGDPPSLMPDVPASLSSRDYLQGRDPALESILKGVPASTNAAGFIIYQNGGLSQSTATVNPSASAGYGIMDSIIEDPAPAGLAIFTASKDGRAVSEAAVPASTTLSNGRIHVETQHSVKTGIAFANPNSESATISYYFTDSIGRDFKHGNMVLAPKSQAARFLDQNPFNSDASFMGTLTWSSTVPIGAAALRTLASDGSELLTTLPVAGLTAPTNQTQVLAHFADGAGWTTQVVLVNPTDLALNGSLQFFGRGSGGQAAPPIEVTVDSRFASSFSYQLPPRSSRRFSTAGSQNEIRVGSVWIVPTGDNPGPSAFGIFTFQSNGKIVSTAGIPALVPRSKLRVFVEASGNFSGGDSGSTMTGLALSNPAENPVTVSYTLRYLNGATARTSSSLIPARSQTSLFLRELPGFESLQTPLQGVLEVNSSAGKIAVVGIRARFNERGDFLFAATPPIDEEDMSRRRLFAHLVDGGGYSTQIVLLPALTNRNATGAIYFFSSSGKPWSLILR